MPKYRFKCETCFHKEIKEMSIKDYSDKNYDDKCPNCKQKMKKVVSNADVIYKGGGYYSKP